MPSSLLKLRSQLVISRQSAGGDSVFVIKDPVTGRFFRLRDAEFTIAQQLDGATPLAVVRQRIQETLGLALEDAELEQFVEQLHRLGLLEGSRDAEPPPPRRRVRGSVLYLRFPAFDPNRILNWLAPKLKFAFTAHFLALSCLLILAGFLVAVLHWPEIAGDLRNLWRFDAFLLAWMILLLVTALHEFAHGVTCKHFGGDVHEMGFMLIYFQPAFYCNVSDAWLFPKKSSRLWVTFAGAYFEIFLWALAALTWRVVNPGTPASFVALVIVATSGIKSLFNLNPLIKLDGYYLLSDYLAIPNLRQRAFAYLFSGWKNLWRAPAGQAAQVSPRERRLYLLYGVLAWCYSSWLLGYIALQLGRHLTAQYRALGLVLFGAILMLFFRSRLTRLLSRAALRSRMRMLRKPAVVLVAVACAAGLLLLGRMELRVSGEFRVLPLRSADVCTAVEGIVAEISVDEGVWVNAGDPIAKLSNPTLYAGLETTIAQIRQQQAELRKLRAGARPEEIAIVQRQLETATAKWEQAQKRYSDARLVREQMLAKAKSASEKAKEKLQFTDGELARVRALVQSGLISRKQTEEAEELASVRRRELEEAQADMRAILADDLGEFQRDIAVAATENQESRARLKLLLAGSRIEEIDAMQAALSRIEAHQRDLKQQIRLLSIVAPISGIVTTPRLQLREKIGRYATKGELIAHVHDLKNVIAEIAVREADIADVKQGYRVVARSRAYFGRSFEGSVKSIAPTVTVAGENGRRVSPNRDGVVLVTTDLRNPSLLLKPEMVGHAKVFCGNRRVFDLMTRRLAGYIRTEFWSWW